MISQRAIWSKTSHHKHNFCQIPEIYCPEHFDHFFSGKHTYRLKHDNHWRAIDFTYIYKYLQIFGYQTILTHVMDLIQTANLGFYKLCTWMRANKLKFHPDKTKFMIFFCNNKKKINLDVCKKILDNNDNSLNEYKRWQTYFSS